MSWFRGKRQTENSLSSEQSAVLQGYQRQLNLYSTELEQTEKELKMRTVLQKEYTLDLIEFAKWQEMISHRKTFCGKL